MLGWHARLGIRQFLSWAKQCCLPICSGIVTDHPGRPEMYFLGRGLVLFKVNDLISLPFSVIYWSLFSQEQLLALYSQVMELLAIFSLSSLLCPYTGKVKVKMLAFAAASS